MKRTVLKGLGAVVLILITIAFKSNTMEKKKVNVKESNIEWTGKKITGSHHGTIKLKEGFLNFDKNKLVGGQFVIDMTSIDVADLTGENKGKLEGHLASDDFFGIETYKTAKLIITEVKKEGDHYSMNGDLTIKNKTNPVTFNLNLAENSAQTEFKIDRTKYGIRYGSGSFFDNLGDNTIHDMFTLKVDLKF